MTGAVAGYQEAGAQAEQYKMGKWWRPTLINTCVLWLRGSAKELLELTAAKEENNDYI